MAQPVWKQINMYEGFSDPEDSDNENEFILCGRARSLKANDKNF